MSNETQTDLTNNNSVKSNKDTKGKKKFSYAYILIVERRRDDGHLR